MDDNRVWLIGNVLVILSETAALCLKDGFGWWSVLILMGIIVEIKYIVTMKKKDRE
ncbi:MAG: hypothetical protein ACI4ES_08060 [Roseburia sp.]